MEKSYLGEITGYMLTKSVNQI